jgi:hypothetical protein
VEQAISYKSTGSSSRKGRRPRSSMIGRRESQHALIVRAVGASRMKLLGEVLRGHAQHVLPSRQARCPSACAICDLQTPVGPSNSTFCRFSTKLHVAGSMMRALCAFGLKWKSKSSSVLACSKLARRTRGSGCLPSRRSTSSVSNARRFWLTLASSRPPKEMPIVSLLRSSYTDASGDFPKGEPLAAVAVMRRSACNTRVGGWTSGNRKAQLSRNHGAHA